MCDVGRTTALDLLICQPGKQVSISNETNTSVELRLLLNPLQQGHGAPCSTASAHLEHKWVQRGCHRYKRLWIPCPSRQGHLHMSLCSYNSGTSFSEKSAKDLLFAGILDFEMQSSFLMEHFF